MKKREFEQQITQYENLLESQMKLFKLIGGVKLLHVGLIGVIVYLSFTNTANQVALIICAVVASLLTGFWIFHGKLKAKINYARGIILINQHHLARISGSWSGFTDTGFEFINHDHPYASDLDIVGQKSIFQFLNTTNTWHGRQKFANDLLNTSYTDSEINQRQTAIAELSKDIAFANHLQYLFSKIGVSAGAKSIEGQLANTTPFMKNRALKSLILYAPLVGALFIVFALLTRIPALYPFVITLISCQLVVWGLSIFKTSQYLADVTALAYNLGEYGEVVKQLQARDFQSAKLQEIKKELVNSQHSAILGIKELDKIASRAKLKHNLIAWLIANMVGLWDLTTALQLETWKQKYAAHASSWFVSLGEFESLLAFSHLPNVCSTTCLPTVVAGKTLIAKELGHPLIINDQRVNNDVTCGNNIFIISGSNMSGKTTFMRSVGVNLILAQAGSFVCATKLEFSQLKIMTSMRIADNLSEGISTFYAELKRIKGIIELAKNEPQMLFLIDEIFRGTNSVDRLIGAKTILNKLNELAVVGMITTHDLELCELANADLRIKNYSFFERYTDNEIHFDYQMVAGVSKTTNAKYLMKMMDII